MSTRIMRRWSPLLVCLLIGGCTEKTIIREVSSNASTESAASDGGLGDDSTADTSKTDDDSNMVSADENSDTTSDANQFNDPLQPDEDLTEEAQISEPVVGAPGMSVDCQVTLPCSWISADSQFSTTVTNADNIGTRDRLQLNYTLSTLHDTQLSITAGGQTLDDKGIQFQPVEQWLGSGVSGNPQSLLAGNPLAGSIVFDKESDSTSLSEWSLSVLDGGIVRTPSFSNIPIGTISTAYADCNGTLPCIWKTPAGDISVTLTTAGGFTTFGQLTTTFSIVSKTTMDVVLDTGALANSTAGDRFEGRTHSLGGKTGFGQITAEAYAGFGLNGLINFAKIPATPSMLHELSLILYPDNPVPRWNPRFINVPLQP